MGIRIAVNKQCCGTCQHWTGGREVVEFGRRVDCETGNHQCPLIRAMYPGLHVPQGKCKTFYKPWVELP